MPVRKYRRSTSEISCCLKYVIFSVNVLFWLVGLCILAVGVWAWNEKDMFTNLTKGSNIALDPAFILICCGTVTFIIGFTGCVGALRENTCLLSAYSIFLVLLLILEISAGMLLFVLRDKGWIKEQATDGLRAFITHYREDPDQQNLIDWIQEDWLQCCGIVGPNDWDNNNYFNCSSLAVGSREACGVPFSCCKRLPDEIIRNKQCGYDVRRESNSSDRVIYEKGCLRAGEDWLERNARAVTGTCVIITTLQIDASKTINEKGCVQAGEEWIERNLIFIASSAIFLAFMQVFVLPKIYEPTSLPKSLNGTDLEFTNFYNDVHKLTGNSLT